MTVKENKNFMNVSLYTLSRIDENELKIAGKSFHMNSRKNRLETALKIENKMIIDKCFLVDRGHKNGKEIHVVTTDGIIYVYNFMKFFTRSYNALVTVLIARPNQVQRLYKACNLAPSEEILEKCFEHTKCKLNME